VSNRAVVVLIGAPAAGKTRTGKRLARILNVPLIDTDKRIVEEYGPISEIFATRGEEHFRSLERVEVIDALREPAVVTLGGGAILDRDTQADLSSLPVVQLTVSAEAVASRITGGKRPLLAAGGVDAWATLVAARRPIYDRISQLTIDTSHQPLDAVATQIARWLDMEHHE
jgi:shikimate kinase